MSYNSCNIFLNMFQLGDEHECFEICDYKHGIYVHVSFFILILVVSGVEAGAFEVDAGGGCYSLNQEVSA